MAATGGVGLAGCSGSNEGEPKTTTPGPTPTQPGEPFAVPFRFDVEVQNGQPTDRNPPLVKVSVTNEDDMAHSLDTATYQFPFTPTRATTDRGMLSLLTHPSDWERGECWVGTPITLDAPNGESFDPGGSITVRRAIMNGTEGRTPQPDVCWPQDTFLLTETYALDSSEPGLYDGEEFSWGFWVRVTDTPAIQVGKIQPFKD